MADGVVEISQRLFRIDLVQAVDVGGLAQSRADDRPFPLVVFQVQAQRLNNQQQVGKDDGGIHAQLFRRGDGDFRNQGGILAQLQEGHAGAQIPILLHIAARLAHQPDGGSVNRFETAGLQEA